MWSVLEIIMPSVANYFSNKKIRDKIENKKDLDIPYNDKALEKLKVEELRRLHEIDMQIKDKLEDKAKTNVMGVTISVTLIMGAYTLVQNISGKLGTSFFFWIAFGLYYVSVLYMLMAGIHAIHVLTAENIIYYPTAGLEESEEKKELNLQIGLNRAQNNLRNNYVFTSYECIRNALICLFLVMVIAVMPFQMKSLKKTYTHGNYYFSEQAMEAIDGGIDKNIIESIIDENITDGEYSVVDQQAQLYIKYSVINGQVTVYLVEPIDSIRGF